MTYSTGNSTYNSIPYIVHHIDVIKMFSGTYNAKTMYYPLSVLSCSSRSPYMDFWMKAHVTDPVVYSIFPTCYIRF